MAEIHVEVHVLSASKSIRVRGALMAADGAMGVTPEGGALGWGALAPDAARVLAIVTSGVVTRAASAWAAEWAGKLEAWRLADTPTRRVSPPRGSGT